MKLVIATPLYPPDIGGPATFAASFEKGLVSRGIRPSVVAFGSPRRFPKGLRHIAYFFRVLRSASRGGIVLALDPVSVGLPALFAARLRGAHFFVRIGGDYAWEQGVQRFGITASLDEFVASRRTVPSLEVRALLYIERLVARAARRVLVQSDYLAGIVQTWGVAPDTIDVVPSSVEAAPLVSRDEARRRLKWPKDEKVILSAGRLVPWKGFGPLIDAAAELAREVPEARLHIAGSGPLFSALEKHAVEKSAHTVFLDAVPRKDLALMLAASDVFALNTGYEGFSHQLLEAFMAGVPVVTTASGGNREIVRDGENALVVPVNDVEALAQAMKTVLRDAELAARLAREARRTAEAFSSEREFEGTYRALGIAGSLRDEKLPNVFMISGDAHALDPYSGTGKRLRLQAEKVRWLEVVVRAPRRASTPLGKHGIVRGFRGPKFFAALSMCRTSRGKRFAVVTAQDPLFLGLVGWLAARKSGAKLQLQLHTDLFSEAYASRSLGARVRTRLARFLLSRADSIRVVSERIKNSLVPLKLRAPVTVLPIYIDADALRAVPRAELEREYLRFSKRLLTVARLEREKNVAAVIAALPAILKEYPDVGLFIAGEGSERRALAARARNLGVQDHVVFLGHRDDIPSLYKAADAVIAATAPYEGYGAVAVEALAAGTPVVSLDVGIAREAGARIASPDGVAEAVIETLRSGVRGELKLKLLSKEEWTREWRASLPLTP